VGPQERCLIQKESRFPGRLVFKDYKDFLCRLSGNWRFSNLSADLYQKSLMEELLERKDEWSRMAAPREITVVPQGKVPSAFSCLELLSTG